MKQYLQIIVVVAIIGLPIFLAVYPWQPKMYGYLAEQFYSPYGRFGRTFARKLMIYQGQEGTEWVGRQITLGERMLEVGCGSGSLTRIVLDRQISAYAFDSQIKTLLMCIEASEVIVEDTHEKFTIEEANLQMIFRRANFTMLRPRKREYNVVYSYDVIHTMHSLKKNLKVMSQLLLKGGLAYICYRHPDKFPYDAIYEAGAKNGLYKNWAIADVEAAMKKQGYLEIENVSTEDDVCVFGQYKKPKEKKREAEEES